MVNLSATLFHACQELLFPPCCLGCRTSLTSSRLPLFCPSCLEQISWLTPPLCPGCGRPWPGGTDRTHFCGPCLQKPPHFQRARATVIYQGPITSAIQACKYQADLAGLSSLAALVHRAPTLARITTAGLAQGVMAADYDYILPVPLHLKRLRQRGFNQALLLARAFFPGQKQKIRFDLLHRQRWTAPQTGMNGSQRRKNLKNAFVVAKAEKIKNRRLLLVDDVFTTGSTVNECARVLRAAGAAEVSVFTLARVRE